MCAQRAHQNNVEFSSVFLPLFLGVGLIAGDETRHVAAVGAAALFFRMVNGVGYSMGAKHALRKVGGLWHVPELYLLYLGGTFAARAL